MDTLNYNAMVGSSPYTDSESLMVRLRNAAKEGDFIKHNHNITYAEVIEWFADNGIFITLNSCFTFALRDKIAFSWVISTVDADNPKLKKMESEDYASFYLCMDDAIDTVLKLYLHDNEGRTE